MNGRYFAELAKVALGKLERPFHPTYAEYRVSIYGSVLAVGRHRHSFCTAIA